MAQHPECCGLIHGGQTPKILNFIEPGTSTITSADHGYKLELASVVYEEMMPWEQHL